MSIENVKEKLGWFKVPVIGQANAGKTTIFKRIYNSTEGPEIYDNKGNKVRLFPYLLS